MSLEAWRVGYLNLSSVGDEVALQCTKHSSKLRDLG